MTFEVTSPYTAERCRALRRYINDIQRTMIIDISLPDKENLWPFAVEAAIYTTNRLVNPKTGISPLTHWRQELNIKLLNRLLSIYAHRDQLCISIYQRPNEYRLGNLRLEPGRGIFVGYEGDNGHVFKV